MIGARVSVDVRGGRVVTGSVKAGIRGLAVARAVTTGGRGVAAGTRAEKSQPQFVTVPRHLHSPGTHILLGPPATLQRLSPNGPGQAAFTLAMTKADAANKNWYTNIPAKLKTLTRMYYNEKMIDWKFFRYSITLHLHPEIIVIIVCEYNVF